MKESKFYLTVKGVFWSAIERFSVQGIQFVIQIILARLLMPSDFGTVAVILVLLNIFQTINESGFLVALINRIDRTEVDFSTVFFFNIIFGLILYIIVYLTAPLFASFFNQPNLIGITRIIGIHLIISSFSTVQTARLLIKIDFKTIAKASLVAVILSGGVGVFCAYQGLGILALVFQYLLNSFLNVILIWFYTKWKPKFAFSYSRFKLLFNFSYKILITRIIDVVYNSFYTVAIGKFYSVTELGYYNRALSFQILSSKNITDIIQRVSTPLLCELQNDHSRLKNALKGFIIYSSMIVFPAMIMLWIFAEPLISVALSDKWLPAANILQLLCPVGMLYVLNTFNRNVFSTIGRPGLLVKLEIVKKIIMTTVLVISIPFGLKAILVGQIIGSFFELTLNTYYTKKLINFGLKDQFHSIMGVLVVVFFTTPFLLVILHLKIENIYKLLLGFGLGSAISLGLFMLLNIGKSRKVFTSFITNKSSNVS